MYICFRIINVDILVPKTRFLNSEQDDAWDFMSVTYNSYDLQVIFELGSGVKTLTITSAATLSDGAWHTVEIYKNREVRCNEVGASSGKHYSYFCILCIQ